MRFVHQVVALMRALFRSRQIDADLADEMRFHVECETEANISRGMSSADARRAARLAFGGIDDVRERSGDERPGAAVRRTLGDVRFGARLLRKSPVFGITAVAIVALAIGASATICSVVYGTMLRPLPFPEPDRLVRVWLIRRGNRNYPAAADIVDLRGLRAVFEDVADYQDINLNLVDAADPRHLQGAAVSANMFAVLRASPAIGRTFAPGEDLAGRDHVVILSDALWRGGFRADSAIVGKSIRLNGFAFTVIGVMRREFEFPSSAYEAWVPHVVEPDELTRATQDNYHVVARLASSATIQQARAATNALARRWAVSLRGYKTVGLSVDTMLDDTMRDVRPTLWLLLGGVSLFLVIASINLSSLFAARARARVAEFAVRRALGASPARLVAQIVAESAPVLAIGGALGLAAAEWAVRIFVLMAPGFPRADGIAVSMPVVAFSLALLVMSGLAASFGPAVHAWRSDFTAAVKDGGRGLTVGRRRAFAQRAGVAAQIALALPLLVGASLLIRSAINVMRVDLGFTSERLTTLRLEASRVRHPTNADVAAYYTGMLELVRALPGVQRASLVNRIPLSGMQTNPVYFENPTTKVAEQANVDSRTVGTDYFATMGIDLVSGRDFAERDDANAPRVAVVDDRVARAFWPGESPIGKRFREPPWRGGDWITVIGVVRHIHTASLETDPLPQVYWSYRQWTQDRMVLSIRSAAEPSSLVPAVVRAIRSVDPEQSVYEIHTMANLVDRSLAQRRLSTLLIIGFAGLALLLAAVGLYGVVTYDVTHRLPELGIRIALGATSVDIVRLVVRGGTSMALVGGAIGLVLAIVAAGLMRSLVYGVAPRDGVSLAAATLSLVLITAVASYLPARRAASVDPGTTLRAE
jgi:putative ABC transport system permease protein